MTDFELLSPWAQMHKEPPTLFVRKLVQLGEGGSGGPPPENSECDVISCILMHFWDGQLEKGNT